MLSLFRGFLFFNILFFSWGPLAFGASFCDGQQQRLISGDPFFEPVFFRAGPSRGKCTKLTPEARIPRVLSFDEAIHFLPYRKMSELVIANVIFEKQLHVARIAPSTRVQVYLVKKYSIYPAAHVSLVFEFSDSDSVHLVPQVKSAGPQLKAPRVLVYDLTGLQAVDDRNSVERAGLFYPKSVITPRVIQAFQDTQSYVRSIPLFRKLEFFPLNVSVEQTNNILLTGIRHAVRRGYRDFFALLNSNCIFDVFRVLDESLGFESSKDKSWGAAIADGLAAFQQRLPMQVERMLIRRGLWVWGKSRILSPVRTGGGA